MRLVESARQGEQGSGLPRARGFLQTRFWAGFKATAGWKNISAAIELSSGDERSCIIPVSVLIRPLALGYSLAYVPHGPELSGAGRHSGSAELNLMGENPNLTEGERGDLAALWGSEPRGEFSSRLADIARLLEGILPGKCLCLRFDLPQYLPDGMDVTGLQLGAPFRAASAVQPPDTVLLDLRGGEEALLAGMKPKWRYNVKLAEKKGVAVRQMKAAEMDDGTRSALIADFYRLYEETSARDRISLHGREYYENLFRMGAGKEASADGVDLRIWFADFSGRVIASIITIGSGGTWTYLYGASSDADRNVMPAYALQWAAIKAAISAGATDYDFFGIPPDASESHPMHGLYRFKTGFGGAVIHRLGCHDYPLRAFAWRAFRAGEDARIWWHKVVMKKLRPRR